MFVEPRKRQWNHKSNLIKCYCSSGVSMTSGGKKSTKTSFLKGLQRSIDIILKWTPACSYFFLLWFCIHFVSKTTRTPAGHFWENNNIFLVFENNISFIEPWLSVYRLKNRLLLVSIDCSPPQMGNKNTVISKKYMLLSRSRLDKNDIF